MGYEDMDLAQLFAAADAIADHRDAEEQEAARMALLEAQAELAEAIGYEDLE